MYNFLSEQQLLERQNPQQNYDFFANIYTTHNQYIQSNSYRNEFEINQVRINQYKIKCSGNNTVKQFCFNKNCTHKNSFICNNYKCSCKNNHRGCQKGDIEYMISQIDSKINLFNQINKKVTQYFKSLIKSIKQLQEELILLLNQHLNEVQLTSFQKTFYNIFNPQNKFNIKKQQNSLSEQKFGQQFTGFNFSQLWNSIKQNKQQRNILMNQFQQLFQKYQNQNQYKKQKQDNKIKYEIKKILHKYQKSMKQSKNIKIVQIRLCPQGHQLYLFNKPTFLVTNNDQYDQFIQCNKCDIKIQDSEEQFTFARCFLCYYDACITCYQTLNKKKLKLKIEN